MAPTFTAVKWSAVYHGIVLTQNGNAPAAHTAHGATAAVDTPLPISADEGADADCASSGAPSPPQASPFSNFRYMVKLILQHKSTPPRPTSFPNRNTQTHLLLMASARRDDHAPAATEMPVARLRRVDS